MIDCPNGDVRDLLPDLLHGRLAPAEHAVVRAHLDGCTLCREELALLDGLRASMRRAPSVDVARVVAALPAPRTPRGIGRGAWRAAAALLLVAGGTTVAVVRQQRTDAPVAAVRAPAGSSAGAPAAIPAPNAATAARITPAAPRELAVATSTVSDLTDRELASLLGDIESLDGVPSTEGEGPSADVLPVTRPGGD